MSTQEASAVTEPTTEPIDAEGAKPAADEALGAPGLAALKSEREAKSAAERRAAAAEARIKEFEDRDKSEAEKQAERLAEFERENAELKSAKTRVEVAATKGVPAELFAGPASNSPEDLAAFADVLIKFKGEPQAPRLHIPNEGKSPTQQSGDDDFVRQLFGKD